jgi:hypothetical protein
MNTMRIQGKGKHLNTSEKYHIFNISEHYLRMNCTNTHTHNVLFKALHVTDAR